MATTANFIKRTKGYDRSQQTITDVYQCQVETANDNSAAIAAVEAKAVPSGYIIDAVDASHIGRNPHWFEVKITYRKGTASGGADDPLDRPSILSASYEEWTEAYDEDHDDPPKKVLNSAKLPFDNLPQRKNGNLVLQITKNFAAYNAIAYDAIKYTTNTGTVTIKGTGYAANTLLFLPPTIQEVYEQIGATTHHYFTVTFRLAVDAGLHKQNVPSRGYKELVNGAWETIRDSNGQPTEDPWPLNEDGTAAASGSDSPFTIEFVPYASASWGIDFD